MPLFCYTDVNECLQNPCAIGSQCINEYGSYTCVTATQTGGAQGLVAEESLGVVPVEAATYNIVNANVIAGMVVIVAMLSVMVTISTLMGVRACKKAQRAKKLRSNAAN